MVRRFVVRDLWSDGPGTLRQAVNRLPTLLKLQPHWRTCLGGSPRIHAVEGALQRSGKSFRSDMRFSAGGSV